jgi:hypothetical protein
LTCHIVTLRDLIHYKVQLGRVLNKNWKKLCHDVACLMCHTCKNYTVKACHTWVQIIIFVMKKILNRNAADVFMMINSLTDNFYFNRNILSKSVKVQSESISDIWKSEKKKKKNKKFMLFKSDLHVLATLETNVLFWEWLSVKNKKDEKKNEKFVLFKSDSHVAAVLETDFFLHSFLKYQK